MRRGKFSKGIMVIGLIFTCTVQFFGCGSKERTENGQGVQESRTEPEFVYVAKHQEFGINGKLGEACPVGDAVYFLAGGETGQKGDVEWQAYSLKTEGVTPALFPLEMEEGSFVSSLCADAEKNLFAVVCRRTDRDANYFLTCYTPEGALVFQTDITELGRNDAYFYIQHMAVDKEGNVYLCSGGSVDDFSTIWIFDGEGSRIGKLPCETWVDALFMLPNGNMAAAMQEEGGACFKEIDAAKETFVKTYGNLPEVCSYGAVLSDHVVLLAGRDQVCQYDLEAEHFEELANWADCDVDGSGISGFGIMEDGRLLAVCQKRSTEEAKAELVYLEKKTPAEAAEAKKELIVLGVMFEGDMGISDAVLRFNQTNETYRIEVVSYGEEDYEAGKLRLDAELVSGSGPDLVRIDHDSMRAYAEQGILEDLYPYIDGEGAMKREDFVESVLAACEMDGILPCFATDFSVDTMIARTSDVGGKSGWSIEEAMALMESKPEETEIFRYGSKRSVLDRFLYGSIDCFINWETGECSFDDGTFEKLLLFANRFPKETAYDEEYSEPQKLRNGTMLLASTQVSGVDSYQMYAELFGEPITFIGYPSDGGTGSYILPAGPVVGMNVNAKNKEGAWEFIKLLLSLEYQSERAKLSFPVLKEALEAKFEESMRPEYQEMDGEQEEQPKFEITYDDWRGKLYAATEEEVNAVRMLIDHAGSVTAFPQEIFNMIMEEADAFFEGQKSARETADIIQSRVQIYVNESR